MKVLIDTNIFISTILFPNSKSALAFTKALYYPYIPITCDYVIQELKSKFNEKFQNHITDLEDFLVIALNTIKVVPTPNHSTDKDKLLRDYKDIPILQCAIISNADYILTGDKDFLEAKIDKPICISASDFLNL